MSVNDEPDIRFNGVKVTQDELAKIGDVWQDAMSKYIADVAKELGVSDDTASAIVYLRSRSRYTEYKEDLLIERDRAGDPIPLGRVLSGEF